MSDNNIKIGSAVPLVPNQEPYVGTLIIRNPEQGYTIEEINPRMDALEELVKKQQAQIDALTTFVHAMIDTPNQR